MERGRGARLSDIRRFFQPRPADASSSAAASGGDRTGLRGSDSLQTAAKAKKKAAGASSPLTPAASREGVAAAGNAAAGNAAAGTAVAARHLHSGSSKKEASSTTSKAATCSPKKRKGVCTAAPTRTPDSNISSKQDTQARPSPAPAPLTSASLIDAGLSCLSAAATTSDAVSKGATRQRQQQSRHAEQHASREDKMLSPRQQRVSMEKCRGGEKDDSLAEEDLSAPGSRSNKKKSRRRLRGGGGGGDACSGKDQGRKAETEDELGDQDASSAVIVAAAGESRKEATPETTQYKEQQPSIRGLLKSKITAITAGRSGSSSSSSSGLLRDRGDSSSAAKKRSSAAAAATTTVKQQVTDIDAFFADVLEEDLHKAKKTTGKAAAAAEDVGADAAAFGMAWGAAGEGDAVDTAAAAEAQQAKENKSGNKPAGRRSSSTKGDGADWRRLLQSMTPARVREQQQHRRTVASSSDEEEERQGKTRIQKEESSNEKKRKRGNAAIGQHKGREGRKQGSSKQAAEGSAAQRRRRSSCASSVDEEFVLSSDSSSLPSSTSDEEEEDEEENQQRVRKKKKQGGEGEVARSPRKKPQQKEQQPPAAGAASAKAAGVNYIKSTKVTGALSGAKTESSSRMSSDNKEKDASTDSLPLAGKTFVFTGVLDSLGRDEAAAIVMRLGGRCTSAVSGRTDFLVMGGVLEDGREVTSGSKYRKAMQLQQQQGLSSSSSSKAAGCAVRGIKIVKEAEFLSLLPAGTVAAAAAATQTPEPMPALLPFAAAIASRGAPPAAAAKALASATASSSTSSSSSKDLLLWAEKYRPSSSQQIVGNKEQLRTLHRWLTDWKEVCLLGKKHYKGTAAATRRQQQQAQRQQQMPQ